VGFYKIPCGGNGRFMDVGISDGNVVCYGMPREIKEPRDLKGMIKKAIESPIGSPRLSHLVKKDSKICILVDDMTRPTPAHQVLPLVIDELSSVGIPDNQIMIVAGSGLHRPMTKEEIDKKIGEEMTRRFPPVLHDAFCEEKLTYIGESSQGTPIWVNTHVAQSDVILGIGGILLHQIAGYGGGAKIILPGISGRKTITYNHNLIPEQLTRGNPENPIRKDMEEIATKVGLKFKIDVVMNAEDKIVGVFAGDFVTEHRRAIQLYNEVYRLKVPEKVDIVLTTTIPKVLSFTQGATEVMCTMPAVTMPGGTIIILCPAYEGFFLGDNRVYENDLRSRLTIDQIRKRVKEGPIYEAAALSNLARVRDQFNFVIVSEVLKPEDIVTMGLGLERSVDKALQAALSRHGKNAKVAVIPYGYCTSPSLGK
jgi:nickel-dependent lactate racemase